MSFVRGRHAFHKRPSSSLTSKKFQAQIPCIALGRRLLMLRVCFTHIKMDFVSSCLETIECDQWGADPISTPNATAETTLHDRIRVSHPRVSARLLF